MKKTTKNKNPILKFKLLAVVVVAVLGVLTASSILAKSTNQDYSLKIPSEQTTISLSDEKPLVVTKNSNGQIVYESRGKSINITARGTVYCTPEDAGDIKIAEITSDQLNETTSDVEASSSTSSETPVIGNNTSVGNVKQLKVSEGATAKTVIENKSSSSTNLKTTEQILDNICAKATQTVPASQVPAFVPRNASTNNTRSSVTQKLSSALIPKVSAGGTATPATPVKEPEISAEVEADQINRINSARKNSKLALLGKSDCLTKAARTWSRQMALVNTLYHSPLVSPIEAECGNNWWSKLGENVGKSGDSASVFKAYMDSPGHRANILDPQYRRIGVGATYYKYPSNNYTTLWTTQLFAACQGSCANK